jgi:hypothetical protein
MSKLRRVWYISFSHVISAKTFLWKLGEEWNVELDIIDMITDARDRSQNTFFKDVMISGCWSLWNQRKRIIFYGTQRGNESCLSHFIASFHQIRHRAKPSLKEGMQDWLDTL